MYDLIVVGGGAAGVFAAIQALAHNPDAKVALLEKSAVLLAKVRVSGGGRCNVTHSCFDSSLLVRNYPRGAQELKGAFHRFQPRDTIDWFESRGVPLKTEEDGRIFPRSDSSQTIIDALLSEAKRLGVEIFLRQRIEKIEKTPAGYQVGALLAKKLLLATGSAADGHRWAAELGHTIHPPVPSLFTFNAPTSPLKPFSGIVIDPVKICLEGGSHTQTGPLLLTHFGFSGPAALKLSAWEARLCAEQQYRFQIQINWLPHSNPSQTYQALLALKQAAPDKSLSSENPFRFPRQFWKQMVSDERRLNDLSHQRLQALAEKLHCDLYLVGGKTTHKEEFVTCGGVTLKEVDFRTMESKISPGLYFAGEILDIDGVTGGFNFQSAWTTGFIAGRAALC